MGLLNFGTRQQVKSQLAHIATGMQLVENEMNKTLGRDISIIRGLTSGLMNEKAKLQYMINELSQSDRNKLNVRIKGQKINYFEFVQYMVSLSNKLDDLTGINFVNGTITKDGVTRQVKL